MRPKFRQSLESYGEIAKDKKEASETAADSGAKGSDELARLATTLDWLITKRAKASLTDEGVQREIYGIQEEKQAIMARMKEELAALDDPERRREGEGPEDARSVKYVGNKYAWRQEDGKEVKVTMGEMVTDLAWGIDYRLDPKTAKRADRKRLIVERAKSRLQELADRQISIEEAANPRAGDGVREAYRRSMEDKDRGEMPFGLIAERMLSQLLRKAIIDKGLPFKYRRADAFQDITQKMDFIIQRIDHARGVRVEEGEGVGTKGIQFTLNSDPEALRRKAQQIDRSKQMLREEDHVDDIVLVQMASRVFGKAYDEWKKAKAPGGPDKLLDAETRRAIIEELTKGMEG